MSDPDSPKPDVEEFRRRAEEPPPGLAREFWLFLRHNKKWWLLPMLAALAILGLLVFLSNTPLPPFIYPF